MKRLFFSFNLPLVFFYSWEYYYYKGNLLYNPNTEPWEQLSPRII